MLAFGAYGKRGETRRLCCRGVFAGTQSKTVLLRIGFGDLGAPVQFGFRV